MTFVNPIEILELQNTDISSIDNAVVKKAKKKLFADIDLSDNGHLAYKGKLLTKTDCERVIDDLENQIVKEFYLHLANNKRLNDYLVKNDELIFTPFNEENIYKLPTFIQFINPHFAFRFDKSLLRAFKEFNSGKVKSILRTQSLINIQHYNSAFKSLSNEIQDRIEEVNGITREINNNESKYSESNIKQVVGLVKDLFPVETLNLLPAYFQSQINKIASALNFLSISIWKNFNSAEVPFKLLEHLLRLKIENVSKAIFEKNYQLYKKTYEERLEQEKNAPILKKWASILLSIQSQIKSVENKSLSSNEAFIKTKELVSISELNSLSSFANEIRTQIGYSIRSLSIACWDKQSDIKVALELIYYALQINASDEAKAKFKQDKNELEEIEKKKWASILLSIQSQIKSVENKSLSSKEAFVKTKELINISELNSLSSFANEIRIQIGYSIRSLSIACWNKQSDIKVALELINYALQINASDEAKAKFKQDKNELEEIEKKHGDILNVDYAIEIIPVCFFCDKNPPKGNSCLKKTIYKETYRSYFPRKVQFIYSQITIPRCGSCKKIHSSGDNIYHIILGAAIILGVIVGDQMNGQHFIIGGIIGTIAGWIIGKLAEGYKVRKKGIKCVSKSTLTKHPLLIERMREGWTFSKPSA